MLKICLLSLLLIAITRIDVKLVAGNGDICQEVLGLCTNDCDERCKARHSQEEKPQGSCDRIGNVMLCDCFYSCGGSPPRPPPVKMCNDGLGVCSLRFCNNDCCNTKCAGLHNGGQGFCDTNVGVSLCQCSYPC